MDFPAFYYGPGDQKRVFQSAEDVPEGWEDHPSKVAEEEVDVMKGLRAEYQEKFGKKAFMGWDEATLREKLA